MPYVIRLRGHDDIKVDDITGEQIKDDWLNYKSAKSKAEKNKRNHVIEVEGFTGQLSDIYNFKQVDRGRDQTAKKKSDHIREIGEKHFSNYKRVVKLSPDEKAKRLSFAKGWHEVITGSPQMSLKKRKQYIDVQREFFKENPHRTICELSKLTTVADHRKATSRKQLDTLMRGAIARLMVHMIAVDRKYAKNRKDRH